MIRKDVHVFLHLVPTNYIVAEKAAAVTVHVALYTDVCTSLVRRET